MMMMMMMFPENLERPDGVCRGSLTKVCPCCEARRSAIGWLARPIKINAHQWTVQKILLKPSPQIYWRFPEWNWVTTHFVPLSGSICHPPKMGRTLRARQIFLHHYGYLDEVEAPGGATIHSSQLDRLMRMDEDGWTWRFAVKISRWIPGWRWCTLIGLIWFSISFSIEAVILLARLSGASTDRVFPRW